MELGFEIKLSEEYKRSINGGSMHRIAEQKSNPGYQKMSGVRRAAAAAYGSGGAKCVSIFNFASGVLISHSSLIISPLFLFSIFPCFSFSCSNG